MRQIGTIERETQARRFAAYLVTEGVSAHTEADGDGWAIWVRDENQIETAKTALTDFRRDPDSSLYQDVERTAESIRREERKRRDEAAKNVVQMRGQWKRGALKRRPLIITLIGLSILVFMMSNGGSNMSGRVIRTMLFCDTMQNVNWDINEPAERLVDVRSGELWRFVTPIFVHYGWMHIAFNMIMLYQLGSVVESRRGTWRIGLMVLAIAVISNGVQALVPMDWGGTPFAGGMSGVLFGLFGYIWMKTLFEPEMGLHISQGSAMFLLGWMFLGISGLAAQYFNLNMANWAHGIGFVVGVAIGYAPTLFRSLRGAT